MEVVDMSAPHVQIPPARQQPGTPGGGVDPGTLRRAVGCFFLFTGGVHLGMVAADTEVYRHFADGALPLVRDAWSDVFMAHPATWALLVMAGELAMGLLLLGGPAAKVGWAGAIAFHVALLLFGWGFWLWSVPALAFLVWAALRDWPALSADRPLRAVPAA
jgi:hypothetical protein